MRCSSLFLVVALVTSACGEASSTHTASAGGPAGSEIDCYKADSFICEIEDAILRATNEYRGATRDPLVYSRELTFASREWSEAQAARGRIGHDGFPSARARDIEEEFGGMNGVAIRAENVAMSGGIAGDAEEIGRRLARLWWNSSGHRANMLGRYELLGVGVARRGEGTYYATQIFGVAR